MENRKEGRGGGWRGWRDRQTDRQTESERVREREIAKFESMKPKVDN